MSDALLAAIREGWSWTGVEVEAVGAVSRFGHLVVRDRAGDHWYLDPDLGSLTRIGDAAALPAFWADPEVEEVWRASALVAAARDRLGEPRPGECYSLKLPALIGGAFAPDNLCIRPVAELFRLHGDLARQLEGLPDGTPVQLVVTD